MRKYGYPVWATQGGGLVREVNSTYIFVESPHVPGLDVGDEMPKQWGLIPANDEAMEEMAASDPMRIESDDEMLELEALMEKALDHSFRV